MEITYTTAQVDAIIRATAEAAANAAAEAAAKVALPSEPSIWDEFTKPEDAITIFVLRAAYKAAADARDAIDAAAGNVRPVQYFDGE